MLLPILIRFMGSFIDGFQDMEIKVSKKTQFATCSFGNKGTKKYLVKYFILFVAYFKQKPHSI